MLRTISLTLALFFFGGFFQSNGIGGGTAQGRFTTLRQNGAQCSAGGSTTIECASAASGLLLVSAAASGTFTVNTTAATANSKVFFTYNRIACGADPANLASLPLPIQGATAAGHFDFFMPTAPTTNAACFNFLVIN